MSKIVLFCLVALAVAIVSEAGPRGRGRDSQGDKDNSLRVRARGRPWRKWVVQREDLEGVVSGEDNAESGDENTTIHIVKPRRGKGNRGRRQWKLRRQIRRRNRLRQTENANKTADDVITDKKNIRMEMKERRINRWKLKMAKKGCFCLDAEKLQKLREMIVDEGREDEFPDIVPEEVVDDIENEDVDDDDDVDISDDDNADGDEMKDEDVLENEVEVVPGELYTPEQPFPS